jgi:O-antigen ligase
MWSGLAEAFRELRRWFLLSGILLGMLMMGILATVSNALVTLRVTSGMLVILCLLRYPYVLLLAWASLNVCIGSSLVFFNGNNLDLALIIPSLLLLGFLPWKQILRRLPGLLLLVLYLGWVLAGIGLSPLEPQAFLTFWLTMLAAVAVSALTIVLVTTRQRLFLLIDTLLVIALAVALYGIYGFLTHQNGEVDPDTHLFRIMSLFTQATTFAFYLSLILPLAFYRVWFLEGKKQLISAGLVLGLLIALLLTFTRSAYVGVFVEVFVLVWCLPVRRIRVWIIGSLGVFSGLACLPVWSGQLPFLARFFNGDVTTLNGRIYLWQALLSHFQLTQWLGQGLQSSDALLAALHVGDDGRGVIGHAPHNLYLGTLYDHGIIGLFLLLALFLSLGRSLLQGIHRSRDERRMLYAVGLATLIDVLLQSLLSRDIWIQAVGASFWIILALPCAFYWSQSQSDYGIESTEAMKPERSLDILPVYSLFN